MCAESALFGRFTYAKRGTTGDERLRTFCAKYGTANTIGGTVGFRVSIKDGGSKASSYNGDVLAGGDGGRTAMGDGASKRFIVTHDTSMAYPSANALPRLVERTSTTDRRQSVTKNEWDASSGSGEIRV